MLVMVMAAMAGSDASPDSLKGWGDLSWGTEPETDMKCELREGVNACTRPSAPPDSFLGVPLTSVSYEFLDDRLASVVLEASSPSALRDALTVTFGRNSLTDGQPSWHADRVEIRLTEKGGAWIGYLPIARPPSQSRVAATIGVDMSDSSSGTYRTVASGDVFRGSGAQVECTAFLLQTSGPMLPTKRDLSDASNLNPVRLPPGWSPVGGGTLPTSLSSQVYPFVVACRPAE